MGKELDIEKLTGNDNFHTWSFAMKNLIDYKGYSNCIKTVENDKKEKVCAEKDEAKILACKALIILCVEKNIYTHITACNSAIGVWEKLRKMFDTAGISRKIAILRGMLSCKLEDADNMQSYVDEIISGGNKLKGIGFDITDEWLGAILLAGLTENFRPLIMAIEATTNEIKSDVIISKLLDAQPNPNKGSGFFSKRKPSKSYSNVKNEKKMQKLWQR